MSELIAGVGDEAVESATGHPWAHWLAVLDGVDGTTLDHPGRVAALADAGVESGWWRQTIAVGYEQERGLREVGETADAGFEIGVQRTLPVGRDELWTALTAGDALAAWLDPAEPLVLEPGAEYRTSDGATGEIRTVSPGERLRLTYRPAGREEPTTLQLALRCPRNRTAKTTLRVHQERLADAAEREAMREHWRAVLDSVAAVVGDGEASG